MKKAITKASSSIFEQLKHLNEQGNEYWTARELAKILDYTYYRNFKSVIEKAKEACQNSGYSTSDHIVEFNDMIEVGKGAKRQIDNVKLSRYACYLIVQNADPSKEIVATGQTYFAVQTRLQEISKMQEYTRLTDENEKRLFLRNELKKHNLQLAEAAKDAGVIEPIDYAIFQNHGYMGLYGGLDAKAIHHKKKPIKPILKLAGRCEKRLRNSEAPCPKIFLLKRISKKSNSLTKRSSPNHEKSTENRPDLPFRPLWQT